MAFLKCNRLWKPAADLILRAKSSIKTISSRNQSILPSTSKFLLDQDKGNRQRRIDRHSTNFFGNGPSYYRYYSVDEREKRRIEEELNRCLTSLEKDEPCNNIRMLLRTPYYCSKYKCEQRFLAVFERWWSRMKSVEDGKPTSTIFHLGALNKNYDGIIIKKLYEFDRLKSLKALVDEAAAVDFCSLPDSRDVLSFLNGIRDLTMDAEFTKVLHPSLIPSRTELFKNIDNYLREKAPIRKRQHDRNPSVDSDWIFMIGREAPGIFTWLAFNFQIPYSDLNDFERDVLKCLCGLIKEGYDYSVETATLYDDVRGFQMDYSNFAHAWLLWNNFDPDDLVRDIWRSWFSVYRIYLRIGSNDVHGFNVCGTLVGVCEHFHKVDSFLPVFDIWLDDVRKLSPLITRCDSKQGEVVESFTDFIYNAGQCCVYFASINRRDMIDRMEPVFLLVAMDALDALEGKRVSSIAITRYLTGIRDFRSAISKSTGSNISYPTEFNDKLLKYLNERMDHETSNCTKEVLLDNAARLVLLLRRSEIKLDVDLWRKLLTPLRSENSRSAFDGDEQNLGIIVAYFGEAMSHYSSIFDKTCQLQIPNDVMTGYFELAERFLTNVDPNRKGIPTDAAEYPYALGAVLSVANRFNAIKEFKKLKQDWEKHMIVSVDHIQPRAAAFATKQMDQMSKHHRVKFDSTLQEKMGRRGEGAFERKK